MRLSSIMTDAIISATPRSDKPILLGEFNARVGTDHQTWEGYRSRRYWKVQSQLSLAFKEVC